MALPRTAPARTALVALVLMAGGALLAGCTAVSGSASPGSSASAPATPAAPPPQPPAACVLDPVALAAATGLSWIPDASTASDTRCVYDPAPAGTPGPGSANPAPATPAPPASTPAAPNPAATDPGGPAFVAVDITPATGGSPAAQLDTVAALCDPGSRVPVAAADGGLVCRFEGGSVFSALVTGGKVLTVAASAVPAGTTADALQQALTAELTRIGG